MEIFKDLPIQEMIVNPSNNVSRRPRNDEVKFMFKKVYDSIGSIQRERKIQTYDHTYRVLFERE